MIRPLYKSVEPFMEVERGFGYLGVIQYDDVEDRVQCHVCGKWFKALPNHLKSHNMSSVDYRDIYSLPLRGGLLALGTAKKRSDVSSRPSNIKHLSKVRKHPWNVPSVQRRAMAHKVGRRVMLGKSRLSFKNKNGLCPAQIEARYTVVKEIVQHEPSMNDVYKHDPQLHYKLKQIGFNKWKSTRGLKTENRGGLIVFGRLDLIALLRKWVYINKKLPSKEDFHKAKSGFPSYTPFLRNFGSWQNALTQAGLK